MEQIAAILLIVGCNAEMSSCREVPLPEPIQASLSACEAARPLAMRMAGAGDSKVFSTCVPIEAGENPHSVSLAWALTRGGNLAVQVGEPKNLVAAR